MPQVCHRPALTATYAPGGGVGRPASLSPQHSTPPSSARMPQVWPIAGADGTEPAAGRRRLPNVIGAAGKSASWRTRLSSGEIAGGAILIIPVIVAPARYLPAAAHPAGVPMSHAHPGKVVVRWRRCRRDVLVGGQNGAGMVPAAGSAPGRHRAGIVFTHADRPETSRNQDGIFRIAGRVAQQFAVAAQSANISRRRADRHIAAAGQRQFLDPGWMIRLETYHGSAGPQGAHPVGGSGDGGKSRRPGAALGS